MSFMKPKIPNVPAAAPAPTEAEQVAARVKQSETAQRDWAIGRRASETNVGGDAMEREAQAGRGLLSMQKRKAARQDLYGAGG